MFSALDFFIDGKALSSYDCMFIQSISSSETQKGVGVKIYQDTLFRDSKPYYQGSSYSGNKKFQVLIGKEAPMTEGEVDSVKNWLEGYVKGYRDMTFIQDDLFQLTFKVIIEDVSTKYLGNQPVGILLSIVCDSPYAYEPIMEYALTKTTTSHYCNSSNSDFIKPIITFKSSKANGVIKIQNTTINKAFEMKGLIQDEVITVNMRTQEITSSIREYVASSYVGGWFYLVKGNNNLAITGDFVDLKCKYANERKVL